MEKRSSRNKKHERSKGKDYISRTQRPVHATLYVPGQVPVQLIKFQCQRLITDSLINDQTRVIGDRRLPTLGWLEVVAFCI